LAYGGSDTCHSSILRMSAASLRQHAPSNRACAALQCSSVTLRSDPTHMGHSSAWGYEAGHASRSASLHRVQISNQVATQFYTTSPASANEWCVARTCESHHNSNKTASRHMHDAFIGTVGYADPNGQH
jgi:hypothetical protein